MYQMLQGEPAKEAAKIAEGFMIQNPCGQVWTTYSSLMLGQVSLVLCDQLSFPSPQVKKTHKTI